MWYVLLQIKLLTIVLFFPWCTINMTALLLTLCRMEVPKWTVPCSVLGWRTEHWRNLDSPHTACSNSEIPIGSFKLPTCFNKNIASCYPSVFGEPNAWWWSVWRGGADQHSGVFRVRIGHFTCKLRSVRLETKFLWGWGVQGNVNATVPISCLLTSQMATTLWHRCIHWLLPWMLLIRFAACGQGSTSYKHDCPSKTSRPYPWPPLPISHQHQDSSHPFLLTLSSWFLHKKNSLFNYPWLILSKKALISFGTISPLAAIHGNYLQRHTEHREGRFGKSGQRRDKGGFWCLRGQQQGLGLNCLWAPCSDYLF
mgnify:CR=1 FL=1